MTCLTPNPVQDPIYIIPQMGCDRVYDYRQRLSNLIPNVASPELNLGANILTNGGFEGTYVGGVAPSWNWVGTGTPSEETVLPWDSPGVSAQRVDGDTKYGGFILSNSMTGLLLQHQTYMVKFKVKVIDGYLRVRTTCYNVPFEITNVLDFGPGDEGEFIIFGACGRNPATAISQQLYNIGTTTPLTFIIDDMEVLPVQNDTHIYIDSQGFDEGAHDGDSYYYSGGSWDHAKNWNKNGDMNPGGQNLFFSLLDPDATCYTLQAYWNSADSDKGIVHELWPSSPSVKSNVSSDGAAHSQYETFGIAPHTISDLCVLNEYDDSGGTEETRVNGTVYSTSYISGSHVNPLYEANGTPYLHGAFISGAGSFIERAVGKYRVLGYFRDQLVPDDTKELLEAILLYNR